MQLLPLLLLLQGQWNVDKMHQSLTFLRGNTFFCSWQTASSRHQPYRPFFALHRALLNQRDMSFLKASRLPLF